MVVMCARLRCSIVVALTAASLVACGDPGSGSPGDATAPTSSLDDASRTPASSTADTLPQPDGDGSGTTEAPQIDDVVAVPTALERCSDVSQITTDVLSDNTQGNIDPILHGVLLTYAADHPDTFGGLWIDR